jgi:hypothetical protein
MRATDEKGLICSSCERGDLNPHALRHRILSPARLPFRHSRVGKNILKMRGFLKGRAISF